MLTIFVTYTAKDSETINAFYDAVKTAGVIEGSRDEERNIQYDYLRPEDESNQIYLVEKWPDRDAHNYHKAMPHFSKLADIKSEFGVETKVITEETDE